MAMELETFLETNSLIVLNQVLANRDEYTQCTWQEGDL